MSHPLLAITDALGQSLEGQIPAGTTVLDGANLLGALVPTTCGGFLRCWDCRVQVQEGMAELSPPSDREQRVLRRLGLPADHRLACQAQVRGPVRIRVPSPPSVPPVTPKRDPRKVPPP